MPPTTLPEDLQSRLYVALDAARAAGEAAFGRFRSGDFLIDTKADASPVTQADREAEAAARRVIEQAYPADSILGEEHGSREGSSRCRWIIDPIDGTMSFVLGVPLWGTLVALETINDDGTTNPPCVGVIHMPALTETVYAATGMGAWHLRPYRGDAVPARVSTTPATGEGMALFTGHSYFREAGGPALLGSLLNRFRHSRGWSDCYAHVLVATGRADACLEPQLSVWDIAAVYPIIAEAGGRCTSWTGSIDPRAGSAVVTNGLVHDQLLAAIRAASLEHGVQLGS
jgi:histidinol-phosphatase